jgi:hypothetical protein
VGGRRAGGYEFEACIKLSSSAIGFGLGGFIALDFNEDDFLCAFFLGATVVRTLSGGLFFLSGPSIVLIAP